MRLLFWGKANKDLHWHPALLHMLDVGLVAQALVHDALNEDALRRSSEWLGLTLENLFRWLPFLVAAHDLGKVSPGFQRKVEALCVPVKKAGFPFEGDLESDHGLVTRVALGDLLPHSNLWPKSRPRDAKALAAAVAAHHGTFHTSMQTQGYRPRKAAEGEKWDSARRDVLICLAGIFEMDLVSSAITLCEDSRAACLEWLAGFTTLCDWVGSSDDFRYCDDPSIDLEHYVRDRHETVRQALASRGLSASGFVANVPRSFAAMFPATPVPRAAQRRVLELTAQSDAELVVVEAATGAGKTEAALAVAEYWGTTTRMQGVYLALPTMATSNSLFGRVRDWVGGMHGGNFQFHLLHGHALLNPDYEALLNETQFTAISPDGSESSGGEVVASSWFTGRKRGLLAPFAVGTIDQALLSVLGARHQFLRLYGLAHKVMIFDEIHAYDTYTSALIEQLLRWARAMGCRVVLLSATLPTGKLRSLVSAWMGCQVSLPGNLPPLPRVTLAGKGGVTVEALPQAGSTRPAVQIRRIASARELIADSVVKALQGQGCAACICNTVRSAQDLYTALKDRLGSEHVTLIHARMPLGERLRREERILADFGRNAQERPESHVVVGTQVLEQSLDVDFDLMFSELAPVDLILQRVGRLHRHERSSRPAHLARPCLLLEESGCENARPTFRRSDRFVYSEAVLLRSWFALRTRCQVTGDDVCDLISQVYDGQCQEIGEEESEWIADADAKERRKTAKEVSEAEMRMIDMPESESFPDDPRTTAGLLEEDNPAVHYALQALTRLGPPSIGLVCLYRVGDEVFLDPDATVPVALSVRPSPQMRRLLVQASVSVSNRAVYEHFGRELPPEAWRKDPVLRHMRLVEFEFGKFESPGFALILDPEMGLLVETSGKEDRNGYTQVCEKGISDL